MSESDESGGRAGLRWSVEQRVAFAARRLYWDGVINREDLVRRFGVSQNQATADLARLREAYPDQFAYDTVAKRYRAGAGFRPGEADAASLLTELRLIAEGHLAPEASVLGAPPPLALAGLRERAVETGVLRTLLTAIGAGRAVAARYVSFQRPGESRRVLSPHALVFDGFRWHVRAHDAGDDRFKDFVIARLSVPDEAGERRRGAEADQAWQRMVTLVIAPHPGLDPHQRRVIARDYGMERGRLRVPVREAVLFYVRRRFGLTEGHEQRPAQEQHIVLERMIGGDEALAGG
ncbi:MAG: WYL domain-containing protein [Rhodospirillales bacterium]|nr:WYL domain-containing protein [Rhodospirillales bacterium]